MNILALFLLCIFTSYAYGATVVFDISQEGGCLQELGGCDFNNASIWLNNAAPSTNDSVVIEGSGSYSSPLLLVLPDGYQVQLISARIQSAGLQVNNASTLSLSFLSLNNSFLSVIEGGWLQGLEYPNITVSSSSRLLINGTMSWLGDLLLYGETSLSHESSILWGNTTLAPVASSSINSMVETNDLTILPGFFAEFPAGLEVNSQLVLAGNCSLSIQDTFLLGDVQELRSGKLILASNTTLTLSNAASLITCPNGTFGTGNISIYDSQVNFDNPVLTVFNGSVFVSGTSTVQFIHTNVRNLHLGSDSDNVIIMGNDFGVSGIADGYGTLRITGAGWNISGLFAINGPIQATNTNIIATKNSTLILSPPDAFDFQNTTIQLAGNIQGNILITETSFLNTTYDNSTIIGNVENRGILHVAENHILFVKGNFAQLSTAVLRVDLMNVNQSAINITNATSVVIAGDLQYRIAKKPFLHSAKYPIVSTLDVEISGKFNNNTASALSASTVTRLLKIEVDPKIIYIVYDFKVKDVEAWEWAVISIVIAVVVAVAITCIIRFRTNRAYQTID